MQTMVDESQPLPTTIPLSSPRANPRRSRILALLGLLFAAVLPLFGFVTLQMQQVSGFDALPLLLLYVAASGASALIGLVLSFVAMLHRQRSTLAPIALTISLVILGVLLVPFV